jgi:hypothetical protein
MSPLNNIPSIPDNNKHPPSDNQVINIYMEQQGFIWDSQSQSYVKSQLEKPSPSNKSSKSQKYIPLLEMLLENKDRLEALLQIFSGITSKHEFNFKNERANKTIFISKELQRLIKRYGREYGMLQNEIIEMALVQFFMSNDYEKYLKEILIEKTKEKMTKEKYQPCLK